MSKRRRNNAGIVITVIFHFTVILLLFIQQMDVARQMETSFVMDFTKQEDLEKQMKELEELQKEVEKMADIKQKLEEKLATNIPSTTQSDVKNIAVNSGKPLKDDRGTDAEQLYKDAERLANELKKGQNAQEDAREETVELPSKENKSDEKKKEYSGPSVVSYNLDGRKASHLKIPAYRCYGCGDVTVIITVDPQGNVVAAKVLDEISSSDSCLRSFAVRAARLSKFSASSSAPARQNGEILYRFIAQ